MLKVENLWFSYKDKEVLRGIHLELSKGEIAFVGGPNGAGKSTFLRVLVGALRGKGKIEMCGSIVQGEGLFVPVERRCAIYVPQRADVLPHKTVEENLSFAGNLEEGLELINDLGVKDTKVKANRLSGGQRKRLALAMALISSKPLLLLDEPLSAIDPSSRVEILERVVAEVKNRGKAAVWVSHFREVLESGYGKRYELREGRLRGCEEML